MSGHPNPPLDIAALRRALEATGGRRFWRELDDLAAADALDGLLQDEFPSLGEFPNGSRREFLRIMAASLVLAGVAGCSGRERSDDALPYVNQPEDVVPGRPTYYATATLFEGYAQPVLAAMHRGRPVKLEGNPEHPLTRGATDLFMQASILGLYDPDRSQAPLHRGAPTAWAEIDRLFASLRPRWRANGGGGLSILLGATTSPTLLRQLGRLTADLPAARIHAFEPVGSGLRHAATQLALGRPLDVRHRLDRAKVIVSLDDDLLGPGPEQVAYVRDWASRRGEKVPAAERVRLHMAESSPTQTGTAALAKLPVAASRIPVLGAAIGARLGVGAGPSGELSPPEEDWVAAAADDLKRHAGRSLLSVGIRHPPEAQALAYAVNEALGNAGATVWYAEPIALAPIGPIGSIEDLARDLDEGRVDTLVVVEANPAYAAPADLAFADRMRRAKLTIHAGLYVDETAVASEWHLPLPHPLETWSDARAIDGTKTILQPLIAPLYSSRSVHELIAGFTEDQGTSAYDIVRATWRPVFGAGFEKEWRRALHDGFVPGTASEPVAVSAKAPDLPPPGLSMGGDGIEVSFRPDLTVWDGRYANNAWLQEIGKPLLMVTWDNVVAVSPKLAEARKLSNGNRVRIEADGRAVEGPVWILPGQPEATIALFLGYGRRQAGRVGSRIGYDANALRSSASPWFIQNAGLRRVEGQHALATMQIHGTLEGSGVEGKDVVRVVTPRHPVAEKEKDRNQASIYPEWPQEEPAWAMVIDLDLCTGCNACTIACQAENNVPVVGKEEVARRHWMHWLRVDRYYTGDLDEPEIYFQPVPCMHCEQAPCEVGCPVHATVHGPDGLNQQIYNRCIGTRTCSSYCPYKVRRFNWYDYTSGAPEAVQARRNPDVTVRGRGVMEKCTYCVQRIRAAHVEADKENRRIRDSEVQTACAAACPSRAITFGDLKDAEGAVAKARSSPRNYALLGHLGTRPRTTYLARISDAEETEEGEP